ncbi:protein-L-isoaspartate(D-aspartate) O-methyltransferase [Alkaliflexus imshenetskii]|uniref:protein-L-isoaspartate(D-aspartate) O-methyltransferase n=1 Tax=Alkaliflexus imshenetskii TaxID=286730 RepID=UPI000A03047B|nr:protein-L-isoaspartate(D-aspartate) O-methyltransferase [Alkaliflexus imshenetskii]
MQKQFIKYQIIKQKHSRYLKAPAVLVLLLTTLLIMNNNSLMAQNWNTLRAKMVNEQLRSRDIRSKSVLDAMREVPRHEFVPDEMKRMAYEDRPLPIGYNQTISQPYIVAFMTEQINPKAGMKVLEIGTGSGYQAAILAQLECEVYTIELVPELAKQAQQTLDNLNFTNVTVMAGNGYLGWPEHAPFDAIVVTAAPEEIPPKLIEQLADGGVMVLPVGPVNSLQYLKLVRKKGDKITTTTLMPVRFVPMIDR